LVTTRPRKQHTNRTKKTQEADRYIAYLEVLGTSDLARYDRRSYYESLAAFQKNLVDKAKVLNGSVYFFSDTALVESPSAEGILTFIGDVRSALLDRGYYLKGAVSQGILDANNHAERVGSTRVNGSSFGVAVANVVDLHNTLRGIGIRLDSQAEDLLGAAREKSLVVQTCHFPEPDSRHVEPLFDLRYRDDDVDTEEVLLMMLKRFHQTNLRSKRLGRYYLTALVSWIRSTDFTAAIGSLHSDTEMYPPETPLILRKALLSEELRTFKGGPLILFALLDQIYSDTYKHDVERPNEALARKVTAAVTRRKRTFINEIERVPEFVLDKRSRRRIIDYIVDPSSTNA